MFLLKIREPHYRDYPKISHPLDSCACLAPDPKPAGSTRQEMGAWGGFVTNWLPCRM